MAFEGKTVCFERNGFEESDMMMMRSLNWWRSTTAAVAMTMVVGGGKVGVRVVAAAA